MSLARHHRERTLAALAAGKPQGTSGPAAMPTEGAIGSEYQLMLAALGIDLNELRNIESIERKIEAKRRMIDRYRPWVEGALSAESAAQDDIVGNMLIWAIDVADWPYALAIAEHVLRHGLALPERYVRKPATLIAEEFAEAGLKNPPEINLATLRAAEVLVTVADIHDQVRAKMHKAIGLAFAAQAEAFDATAESAMAGGKAALLDNAVTHFHRALALNPACGVKKMIEAHTREIKKLAPAEGQSA